MPTVAERLAQVQSKILRAQKHIADVASETSRFLATRPYCVTTRRQPDTNKLVYYVASVRPVPQSLSLIAGDVIQNLMSALDHLAYQTVCNDTADNPPNPSGIYFPIGEDAQDYARRRKSRMQGAKPASLAAIDALAPYRGGNELFWRLYRLNNIDKHRTLLTVGARNRSVDLGHYGIGKLIVSMKPVVTAEVHAKLLEMLPGLHAHFAPADQGFPLSVGFELLIVGADDEPDSGIQFAFDVALHERGVCEGTSLFETLSQLTTLVEQTTASLTHLLR